jgi:S1-C subfamily serine protease
MSSQGATVYPSLDYDGTAFHVSSTADALDEGLYQQRWSGQFGPSSWYTNTTPNVSAIAHISDENVWIFAVLTDIYTKMIGVTIVNGQESLTDDRQARYHVRISDAAAQDRTLLSDTWDTGTIISYGMDTYFLHTLDMQAPSVHLIGDAHAILYEGNAFTGPHVIVEKDTPDLSQHPGWWYGAITSIKVLASHRTSAAVYAENKDAAVSIYVQHTNTVGSGFLYERAGQVYIVTAAHVIMGSNRNSMAVGPIWAAVSTAEGTLRVQCSVVGIAGMADVGVLMPTSAITTIHTLDFAVSCPPPGSNCYVIGDPLGIDAISISEGVVRDSQYVFHYSPPNNLIESVSITCVVYGGNSGSPIIDQVGRVIGLISYGVGNVFSWGVSSPSLRTLVERIVDRGTNFIGRRLPATLIMIDLWALHVYGIQSISVLEGMYVITSNNTVGLFSGDIILEIDGRRVGLYYQHSHVTPMALYTAEATSITLTVQRTTGSTEQVTVTTVPVALEDDTPLFSNESTTTDDRGTPFYHHQLRKEA